METLKKLSICIIFLLLLSCRNNSVSQISIIPLHPYSASPHFYDTSDHKVSSFITKYYFIKNAKYASEILSIKIDSFLNKKLPTDSDFQEYGGFNILFFKESNSINQEYRYKGTDNTPESHKEDLLFEYQWTNKKFRTCLFYRNGKVLKSEQSKKGKLFSYDSTIHFPETPIKLEEIP